MKNKSLFLLPLLLSTSLLYGQQAGTLDTSFGTDGKKSILLYEGTDYFGVYECIYSLGLQSDGKIIGVGGAGEDSYNMQRLITRFTIDGELDTSFGVGGALLLGNEMAGNVFLSAAVQPDDKIVAVGRYNSDFTVSRFHPDGSLDTDFGPGGIVSAEYTENSDDDAFAVALQEDGKIVVGGNTYNTWETPWSANFFIMRYNSDGTPDMSFGSGGKVITDFHGQEDHIRALAIQADGKILAAGDATSGNERNFAIARYNTDGSLDEGFGDAGKVETNIEYENGNTTFSVIRSLIVLEDGKILAAGSTNQAGYVLGMARFNSDGTLDSTFGNDGKVKTQSGPGTKIAVQADGKIVAGGGYGDYIVARYHSDGSVDSGFGDQGETVTDFEGYTDRPQALLLQPDGKILLAGGSEDDNLYYGATMLGIARYHGGVSVGMEEVSHAGNLIGIYPNPVRDFLYFDTGDSHIQEINLYSITGQALESLEAQSHINMSEFPAGVYFVRITTTDGRVAVEKVVVE